MKKPSILFVLHWPPPVHGSSVVGLQIKESKLINSNFNCNYINLGTSKSINEIGRNGFNKIFRYFSIVTQLLKILIKKRPDLCYFAITVNGIAFYKDTFLIMLIKLFGVKLAYHFHNKGVSLNQNKFTYNLFYRIVFKNDDAIILSNFLYSDVQNYIPKSKIHICHNGIPDVKHPKIINHKKEKGIVKILFLSNLIESKGVFVLLEACSILKKKNILFECDFIGGEGDISVAQFESKVRKLNLSSHVKYLGKKYGDEKNYVFANSDIFAFPTFYDNECFPLVLLEALQHGLPIVSTYEGGIKDIVEDGKVGFLVEQKNIHEFATKLETLALDYELRFKLGEAGKLKYQKEFTLNKFERSMTEILSQILR